MNGDRALLLEAFADAWNRHDLDALMSMMTTDCVFEASGGNLVNGERHDGQLAVRAAFAAVFEQYADAHWGDARHVVAGDRGVSEWTFTGTAKDGTRVEVTGCDLLTFRDGKIAIKNSFRKNRPPIARSHQWHAIECNNLAWQLSDQPERTPLQDEEMLNAAHASAFHWARVGSELNLARARMLLGHVHATLGAGQTAWMYAQQSYDYLAAHTPPDWEMAFAHAILAHAAFAAGDAGLHRRHYVRAQELGQAIADSEDQGLFLKTFDRIPRP